MKLLDRIDPANNHCQCTHLDNHCVNLVGAELELVAGEGVGETKLHGSHLLVGEA